MADGRSEASLYEALGVPRTASAAEIKGRYRELARALHPDRRPGDPEAEERFKRVTAAYQILHDPRKRQLYDEFGAVALRDGFDPDAYRTWERRARGAGYRGSLEDLLGRMRDGGRALDLEEALSGRGLEELLAARPAARRVRRGRDLTVEVRIGFVEALRGVERELAISAPVLGARTIRARLPAGVQDGELLRLPGQGGPARGRGPAGDLILSVRVEPHPCFWREGDDLHVRVPITASEAYAGAKVRVPTPGGDVTISVPPGSAGGKKLRVRGRGAPGRGGRGPGDLVAHLQICLPPLGDERVRALLAEADGAHGRDVRAALHL